MRKRNGVVEIGRNRKEGVWKNVREEGKLNKEWRGGRGHVGVGPSSWRVNSKRRKGVCDCDEKLWSW